MFIIITLVIILYLITSICINIIIKPYLEEVAIEKFQYTNTQRFNEFNNLRIGIEQMSKGIISQDIIQESLIIDHNDRENKIQIENILRAYIQEMVTNIIYIDNKKNIMNSGYHYQLNNKNIHNMIADSVLLETYALPVWNLMSISLYNQTDSNHLYVMHYVRHLSVNTSPGILIYEIDVGALQDIVSKTSIDGEKVFMINHLNEIIFPYDISDADEANVGDILKDQDTGRKMWGENVSWFGSDLVGYSVDYKTGWQVISFVSHNILMKKLTSLQTILKLLLILMLMISVVVILILSAFYVKPIKTITYAMRSFNNRVFCERIKERLPGEFGEMGETFNNMADEIDTLIEDARKKHKALQIAELDSLMYQINPHFIYNTLDNIYMLARFIKDERIGQLIDALSKFLRISLNKGGSLIKLKEELEHVKNYLLIQQMRYDNLFDIKINISSEVEEYEVLKFILQPIAENCIKHGFSQIMKGGKIEIIGYGDNDFVCIDVYDNGIGIDLNIAKALNNIHSLTLNEINELFPSNKGGYGIANVIARLRLYYNNNFEMKFYNEGIGTRCRLKIPKANESL